VEEYRVIEPEIRLNPHGVYHLLNFGVEVFPELPDAY
jgi:hypothetical protein